MKTKEDQRRELVEWNADLGGLTFHETTTTLDDLWGVLARGGGVEDFVAAHPDVGPESAKAVIQLAGDRFAEWPSDPDGQEIARRHAVATGDIRLAVAESVEHRCGGMLVFRGTRLRTPYFWDGLADGETLAGMLAAYPAITQEVAELTLCIGGRLVAEGLVPHESPSRPVFPPNRTGPD